jgi:hypothetical protein
MKRKIQDIAPLLADHFLDVEIKTSTFEIYNSFLSKNAHRIGIYYKYLGVLHDSWFIDSVFSDSNFSIILNDFTTHVFSDVIIEKKNLFIEHEKLIFPIQLDFDITSLSYNIVDETGEIHKIEPLIINEYLFEQIINIDNDKIEIGLVVWKDGKNNEPGKHILILMDVKNIVVKEFQHEAWKEIFGNNYDHYYLYFKSQFDSGRYLSDQSSCSDLYEEYENLFIKKINK